MTVKVSKKDKLSALMTLWEVLKAEGMSARPPATGSASQKLLVAVEKQLKDVLELDTETVTVKVLDMPEVKAKLEEAAKALEELSIKYKDFQMLIYHNLKEMVALALANKSDEALCDLKEFFEVVKTYVGTNTDLNESLSN